MELTGWYVIVPFCFASLLTGLVQALGTPWGLFRHYWILVKLQIAILSTILLLLHMQATSRLAGAAAETIFSGRPWTGCASSLRPTQVPPSWRCSSPQHWRYTSRAA